MSFVTFMGRTPGRAARAVAGAALVGVGAALGGGYWALAAFGLVALLAGTANFCLLAPVFHAPLRPVPTQQG